MFRWYRIAIPVAVSAALSVPVVAGPPPPFPDFEARRVRPPAPGTRKRITVQIEPGREDAAGPRTKDEAAPVETDNATIGSYPAFWARISPALEAAGPGRLDEALSALAASGKVRVPRLQVMQQIARERGVAILKATIGTRISPALVLAVVAVESAGQADATSSAGAEGLMQLMPATAERFGVTDTMAAEDNIAGGVRFLDRLMQEFDGDPVLVLAAYNAGEGAVRSWRGVPPFPETRDYVPRVLAAFNIARGLCRTPPELISDGCVFVTMK